MNQSEARSILWQHGSIASWYLRPSQLDIYELLIACKRPHVECARQFGKTTSILAYVMELLNQNPGWICRWCEPWKEQCHEIVKPAVLKLQEWAPERSRMKWRDKGSQFVHPTNGSILYLRGVNHDKGESSRGPFSNIVVADEFGSWKNARYIVDEVLKPQLETTNGPFIFASTPPEDLGHLYYIYFNEAFMEGRVIQKTIFDNESFTPERIEEIKKDCGGDQTAAWKRERLLDRMKNPERTVIPEFDNTLEGNVVPDDYPVPDYYDCYVGGDNGADDNTVLLFGYYDFLNDEIVIEDELVLNNQTSEVIASRAKEVELELWKREKTPFRRVYDANKQVLIDMVSTHKYTVYLPDKADRIAAIRALRIRVKQRKFKVKARCKVLRHQLNVGMWKDEKHLDFQRSEDEMLKHLDAIAAAVYFNRSVVKNRNPYPQHRGASPYTHLVPEILSSNPEDQAIAEAFTAFGGGG